MNQSLTTRFSNIVTFVLAIIIVLMPFHEFFTTWLGSNFNHLDAWRLWKETLLLLITPLVLYIVYKTPKLRNWLKNDWLVRLILIFILLNLIMGVWSYESGRVNLTALIDGWVTDLRFFVIFIFAAIATYKSDYLKKHWQILLIAPAILVVLFGIAQLFLPIDFLKHFGYGPKTIPAYETVDQKIQYHRIQSTLRGPNPLGAYLILIITALFTNIKKYFYPRILIILLSLVAMFYSYSRSAYLGLIVSLVILYYLIYLKPNLRKRFILICSVLLVLGIIAIVTLRYNSVADNVFFHTSKSSTSQSSSNSIRLSALRTGLSNVYHQPLGDGPGTAGPASAHNKYPARIAENFYIQIAQETGVIGALIFIAINIIVAKRLYKQQSDPMACVLLASLLGISLVNFVSHAWADDTLSLIWWAMAGICLGTAIINEYNKPIKKYETDKKTSKPSQKT